jgi:NTE family protein
MTNLLASIKSCIYFNNLPESVLNEFLPHFEEIKVATGKELFRQGDYSDYVYILIEGELVAIMTRTSGIREMVFVINPIEAVGELGALSSKPRSLTIEAIADSKLLKLPANIFRELCSRHQDVLAESLKLIVDRSLKTIQHMVEGESKYSVTIIFSFIKDDSLEELITMIKQSHVTFIKLEDNDTVKLMKVLIKHEFENNNLIIFMDKWDENIFKIFGRKLQHFYLTVNESEKLHRDKEFVKKLSILHTTYKIKIELVLFHSKAIRQPFLTDKWLQLAPFHLHHHIHFRHEADYKHLVRLMTGRAVLVVLGGGGSKTLGY